MSYVEKNLTGKGVGVAVLDTGIFPHVDFDSRIWAFQDFVNKRTVPYDDCGHGTHVMGILGGSGKASGGKCRGIAPGCGLIALKVLDDKGNGSQDTVIRALDWIQENRETYKIRIVNIWACKADTGSRRCMGQRSCSSSRGRKPRSRTRKHHSSRKQQKNYYSRIFRHVVSKSGDFRKRPHQGMCQ